MRHFAALSFSVCVAIVLASSAQGAAYPVPEPVSPGTGEGVAVTAYRCPTFSWSGVGGAWGYELAIFEEGDDLSLSAVDPYAAQPLRSVQIPPNASSWSPSLDQCLEPDSQYTWFVRERGGPGRRDGSWSAGSKFKVAPLGGPSPWTDEEIEKLFELLVAASNLDDDELQITPDDWFDNVWSRLTTLLDYSGAAATRSYNVLKWTEGIGNLSDVKNSATALLDLLNEGRTVINQNGESPVAALDAGQGLDVQAQAFIKDQVLRQFYQDVAGMIRSFAQEQSAGLKAFEASTDGTKCGPRSDCERFRTALHVAISSMEELLNAVAEFAGPLKPIQLDPLSTLVDQLPSPMLYVLYLADESVDISGRIGGFQSLAQDIRDLNLLSRNAQGNLATVSADTSVMTEPPTAPGVDPRTGTCLLMEGNTEKYRKAAFFIQGVSLYFKTAGAVFQAIGETRFHGEVGAAVVDGALQTSPAATMGKITSGMGDVFGSISGFLYASLNRCKVLDRFNDLAVVLSEQTRSLTENLQSVTVIPILDTKLDAIYEALPDQTLVTNIEAILNELGSLSTLSADGAQTKMDVGVVKTEVSLIKTDVGLAKSEIGVVKSDVGLVKSDVGVLGANVQAVGAFLGTHDQKLADYEVAAGAAFAALQSGAEALQERIEAIGSRVTSLGLATDALQTARIERQLAGCEAMVTLILPAVHGGQAESLADRVRDWIDRAAAAGIKTKDAEVHFARSSTERSSGAYAKAFRSLCNAYGALTSGN